MTSDLGLVYNFSGLGLTTGSNNIYPGHVTTVITIAFLFTRKLRWNILWCLIHSLVKNLLIQQETEEENQLDHLMKKLLTW